MTDYINNDEFEKLVLSYIKKKNKKTEDKLFQHFDKLIDNIIFSFKFKIDQEDAKQDCFVLVLKTLRNFTPEKGKAFNYFTTVILNNLRLVYSKNKLYEKKLSTYISMQDEKLKDLLD